MKLIDQLSVLTDYTNVKVYEFGDEKEIAKHDGRDSIPTELNEREICKVFVDRGWLGVILH